MLNSDPVFQDRALAVFDLMRNIETRIVRSFQEAIHILLRENFELFVVEEGEEMAIEVATHARQHFPSLDIVCLIPQSKNRALREQASLQNIELIETSCGPYQFRRRLRGIVAGFGSPNSSAVEGVDPCHSLIGNLNQFSAAEILQMSCMGQRSGRFTFKSGRGNGEIYLHHGMVRHAVYGSLEGEGAVSEVFRWRQGRFFFEEGIISQVQTVSRPWNHLLIDNLQKLDETMEMVSVPGQR